MKALALIMLAAGKGTRMNSDLPKVLHTVGGTPMVLHGLAAAAPLGAQRTVMVVGHGAELVQSTVSHVHPGAEFIQQTEQHGTGHAVRLCAEALTNFQGTVLVLYGDAPSLTTGVLNEFLHAHRTTKQAITFLSTHVKDPTGFGRMVRNEHGAVVGIVEEKNATDAEKAITEVNTGLLLAESGQLWRLLEQLKPNPPKNEYYLTDLLHLALAAGLPAGAHAMPGGWALLGVNTPEQLAAAEAAYQANNHHSTN